MLKFYRVAALGILALVVLTLLIMYVGFMKSRLDVSLFPGHDSEFPWIPSLEPVTPIAGKTQVIVKNETSIIEYDFSLVQEKDKPYPYAHYSMFFVDQAQSLAHLDLSHYEGISFKIQCDPKNVLLFALLSFDDKVTTFSNPSTRRLSTKTLSCDNQWATIIMKFDKLSTPHWWLNKYGIELSDTGYKLNKTLGFVWTNSSQSPLGISLNVKLTDVKLVGTDSRFIYGAAGLSILFWIIFSVWLIRHYTLAITSDVHERIRLAQPLIAYKKLSVEPQKDKEKTAILHYIATEYADPELSLEMAVTALGINRNKINDLLKDELGLTFSAYLNKLRLTEAARLLAENHEVNVSEIAHLVGYNNTSYFNKLFKLEYNCAPKTFQTLCQQKNTPESIQQ
jgi:AraC-like DNA-binding protein